MKTSNLSIKNLKNHLLSKCIGITFPLLFMSSLISMMCISCGMKESEPSKTKDEVNPVGSHKHYLGNIRIDGPGYRKFPDALKTNVSIEYTTSTETKVQRFPTSSIADHDSFNTAVGPLKGYATKVYFMGDRLNHLWTLLDFTPTEQNFNKSANKFRRIDVNHVLITRQDGTKYFAPGKYVIQYLNRNLQYIDFHRDSLPTRTGIDVPSNQYKIIVDTQTEEGTTIRDESILDLR